MHKTQLLLILDIILKMLFGTIISADEQIKYS